MTYGKGSFDAVLFDLDGTIIDSTECIVQSMGLAFEEFGLRSPDRAAVVSRMGIPLERSLGLIESSLLEDDLRNRLIARYRVHYAALAPELVTLFRGMEGVFEELRSAAVPMAVVTSKKSGPAHTNLSQLGIAEHFRSVVGSDHVVNHKPHPEPALHALREMGIAASPRVLVVGDATFDIEMGTSAGLSTCAVLWGAHDEETLRAVKPGSIVRTTEELRAVCGGR